MAIGPRSTRGPASTGKDTSSASASGTSVATGSPTLASAWPSFSRAVRMRVAGGQHVGGAGRVARCELQGGARHRRHVRRQRHVAQMEQRPGRQRHRHLHRGALRRGVQRVGQPGIVERPAGQGDGHAALVIAETVQRGLQPVDIGAGAADQGERPDRRALAQRDQRRRIVRRLVERGIAGRRDGDVIGRSGRRPGRARPAAPHARTSAAAMPRRPPAAGRAAASDVRVT